MNNKQNPSSTLASLDRPIKATADDAVLAKLATTQAGYYKDPFLENFARRSTGGISSGGPTAMHGERRVIQPIIKKELMPGFALWIGRLEDNVECQKKKIRWYEVDHASVIHEKAALIRQSQQLSYFCPNLKETQHGYETKASDSSSIHNVSSSFHLVDHDLRDSPNLLLEKLSLDPSLPTLFLTECVFMYIPNEASQLLLQALSSCFEHVYMACYEPILGDRNARDPFGHMMEQNLIKAGVASPDSCLLKTRTLPEQLHKLTNSGFARAVGCDMWSAYETILTVEQRKTANQSEFLDEYEEWILIMQHYCFVVATSDPTSPFAAVQNVNDKASKPSLVGFVSNKCNELNKP
ncbi:leucine carboxyl methyltransferase [Nitzschia inconspicua]|uniref:Leucine carboxyl methyltransferase 1 n=1 Tax=Nitzschia inconspicua TaxID=303405 RepID=A0A9K3KZJ1_9STRA|nr:leucine carboxyl methyltransferase [Nitzschia inconspicua]